MEIINVYPYGEEAYLAISVLGEQARGEQPHDHTAQKHRGDEEGGNIGTHFTSLRTNHRQERLTLNS